MTDQVTYSLPLNPDDVARTALVQLPRDITPEELQALINWLYARGVASGVAVQ